MPFPKKIISYVAAPFILFGVVWVIHNGPLSGASEKTQAVTLVFEILCMGMAAFLMLFMAAIEIPVGFQLRNKSRYWRWYWYQAIVQLVWMPVVVLFFCVPLDYLPGHTTFTGMPALMASAAVVVFFPLLLDGVFDIVRNRIDTARNDRMAAKFRHGGALGGRKP